LNADNRVSEIAALLGQLTLLLSTPRTVDVPEPRPAPEQVLLTVAEAASRLGIGKTKAYELITSGELESTTIGRLRRIHVDAVRAYAGRLVSKHRHANRKAA